MAEATSRDVIERYLDDDLRFDRKPFTGLAAFAPATGAAGNRSGEAALRDERPSQLARPLAFGFVHAADETDVIEVFAFVEAQQQRRDCARLAAAKSADDAVGRVCAFDLYRRIAISERVGKIGPLCDDAVQTSDVTREPVPRNIGID